MRAESISSDGSSVDSFISTSAIHSSDNRRYMSQSTSPDPDTYVPAEEMSTSIDSVVNCYLYSKSDHSSFDSRTGSGCSNTSVPDDVEYTLGPSSMTNAETTDGSQTSEYGLTGEEAYEFAQCDFYGYPGPGDNSKASLASGTIERTSSYSSSTSAALARCPFSLSSQIPSSTKLTRPRSWDPLYDISDDERFTGLTNTSADLDTPTETSDPTIQSTARYPVVLTETNPVPSRTASFVNDSSSDTAIFNKPLPAPPTESMTTSTVVRSSDGSSAEIFTGTPMQMTNGAPRRISTPVSAQTSTLVSAQTSTAVPAETRPTDNENWSRYDADLGITGPSNDYGGSLPSYESCDLPAYVLRKPGVRGFISRRWSGAKSYCRSTKSTIANTLRRKEESSASHWPSPSSLSALQVRDDGLEAVRGDFMREDGFQMSTVGDWEQVQTIIFDDFASRASHSPSNAFS